MKMGFKRATWAYGPKIKQMKNKVLKKGRVLQHKGCATPMPKRPNSHQSVVLQHGGVD